MNPTERDAPEDATGRSVPRILAEALVVAAVSLGLAVFRFRAWRQSYSVAFMGAGTDHLQLAAMIRSVHDSGWYFTNSHIGAPFSQQLYDFPHAGESLQLLAIRILTLFSVRPFWVMNTYFLAGFAALAFVTYLVLAHLRFRFVVAAPIALLYTWLPYHFMHGEFHLFRSAYLSAPVAVLMIFWALSWKDRFLRDPDGPVWGPRRLVGNLRGWRVAGAVALCLFIGAFETMVMAFMLVALVVCAAIVAFHHRDIGDLSAAVVIGVVIAATFAMLLVPNIIYKHEHGPNTMAAKRYTSEQILYGLQISKMVLPASTHPIGALGDLAPRAAKNNPAPGEAGQTLGTLGTLGLLGLLYGVVVHRLRVRTGEHVWDRRRLWIQSSLITLVLILFATMSGFALVLSLFGFSQIRVWDRAVVLIAFCAFLLVGQALEHLQDLVRARLGRAPGHSPGPVQRVAATGAALVIAAAVTVFGLWDTQTAYASSRTNATDDATAQMLRRFDAQMAATIGSDGMVFQLPVVPYPEMPPVNRMKDYEEFLPYLYSNGLRFSYGATKGRPDADWQLAVANADPTPALAGLAGLGFDGILVDTYGYGDGGAAVSAQLTAALGAPVVTTPGGRWRFWDLREFAATRGLDRSSLDRAAEALVGPELFAQLTERR